MPETGKTTRGETDSRGVYTAKGGRQVDGRWWGRHRGGKVDLPYERMTLQEIAAVPVGELAEDNAHLYVWTTNRFLEDTSMLGDALVNGGWLPDDTHSHFAVDEVRFLPKGPPLLRVVLVFETAKVAA